MLINLRYLRTFLSYFGKRSGSRSLILFVGSVRWFCSSVLFVGAVGLLRLGVAPTPKEAPF